VAGRRANESRAKARLSDVIHQNNMVAIRASYQAAQQRRDQTYQIIQHNQRRMQQQALLLLLTPQQQAVQIAAAVAPPDLETADLATSADPVETFLERYRSLSPPQQRKVKARIAAAILLTTELVHSLLKKDAVSSALVLCGLILALYELRTALEEL
jgi:hypothetical protein